MCSPDQSCMTGKFEVIVQECPNDTSVMDKLLQRSEARAMELEKKKLEKDSKSSLNEQTEYFNSVFNLSRKHIESKLDEAENIDKKILIRYFDEIIKDVQKLQKLLSDSTMFLPMYDIKVAQENLKLLQEDIHRVQGTLLPKKKFTFRKKVKVQNGIKELSIPEKVNQVNSAQAQYPSDIENLTNETICMQRSEVDKKDINLNGLQNCHVYLYGAPSTIFINGLIGCQVLIGPVTTSVHIENCSNCTFVVACQQLRVHNTISSMFYLHVTSRTIIEDCSSLKFASYNWVYEKQCDDFAASGLDPSHNNWDTVDDFNWLVSGVPSPNWSLLPKEQYVTWT